AAAAHGADAALTWLQHQPLVEMYAYLGRRGPLIDECRATLDGLGRALGPDAPAIATVSLYLVNALQDRAEGLAEAESLQHRALSITERYYGHDSSLAHEGRTALINIYMRQRNLVSAEAVARDALESSLRMIGPRSSYTVKAKGRLARILTWEEKDLEEA